MVLIVFFDSNPKKPPISAKIFTRYFLIDSNLPLITV